MGTAGSEFLNNILGRTGNEPQTYSNTTGGAPGAPPQPKPSTSERTSQAEQEYAEAQRRAREEEVKRVADGPKTFLDSFIDAGGPQGGTGGGYSFSPEVIAQKIGEWEKRRDDLGKDYRKLRLAYDVIKAPCATAPAEENAEDCRRSIFAAVEHNEGMQAYAQRYIDSLRKANGTYVAHEEDQADALSRGTSDVGTMDK